MDPTRNSNYIIYKFMLNKNTIRRLGVIAKHKRIYLTDIVNQALERYVEAEEERQVELNNELNGTAKDSQ